MSYNPRSPLARLLAALAYVMPVRPGRHRRVPVLPDALISETEAALAADYRRRFIASMNAATDEYPLITQERQLAGREVRLPAHVPGDDLDVGLEIFEPESELALSGAGATR